MYGGKDELREYLANIAEEKEKGRKRRSMRKTWRSGHRRGSVDGRS